MFFQDITQRVSYHFHSPLWVNVNGEEKREGTSLFNDQEIDAVQKIIKLLKQAEGFNEFQSHWDYIKDDFKRLQEQQIGVITFYGEQKKKLKAPKI